MGGYEAPQNTTVAGIYSTFQSFLSQLDLSEQDDCSFSAVLCQSVSDQRNGGTTRKCRTFQNSVEILSVLSVQIIVKNDPTLTRSHDTKKPQCDARVHTAQEEP